MALRSRLLGRHTVTTPQPMSELNITPLIDVLLVLLVMLIMSIPIATHQIEVELPNGNGPASEREQIALTIERSGAVFWNGEAVSETELNRRLAHAAAQPAAPVIRFQPDANASYDASVRVIHAAGDAGISNFAFVGNHHYRAFDAN